MEIVCGVRILQTLHICESVPARKNQACQADGSVRARVAAASYSVLFLLASGLASLQLSPVHFGSVYSCFLIDVRFGPKKEENKLERLS